MSPINRPLRIGISSCFFHADPQRAIFKGKTLLYMVDSIAHWVMSENVLAVLIPSTTERSSIQIGHFAEDLDGLVLEGGADLSPSSYHESPLRPEWSGDLVRDQYEIALLKEFMARKKPVLGVCRGAQLINVAFGGSLYQDIETQVPGARVHRYWEVYDQHFHTVQFEKGTQTDRLYPGFSGGKPAKVNSIHHQGIKDLGRGLTIEARSMSDGIIEAIRLQQDSPEFPEFKDRYVFGVQWHPEFQDPKDTSLLDAQPILQEFLIAVAHRRQQNS